MPLVHISVTERAMIIQLDMRMAFSRFSMWFIPCWSSAPFEHQRILKLLRFPFLTAAELSCSDISSLSLDQRDLSLVDLLLEI